MLEQKAVLGLCKTSGQVDQSSTSYTGLFIFGRGDQKFYSVFAHTKHSLCARISTGFFGAFKALFVDLVALPTGPITIVTI